MASLTRTITRIATSAALVVAVTTHGWLVNSPRELHDGLLSFDSDGAPWSNSELVAAALEDNSQQASKLFAPAGQLTFALAVLGAALLFASIFTASRRVAHATIAVLGLSLASAIVFSSTQPTGPAFGLQSGWSALLFVVAAATGALVSR